MEDFGYRNLIVWQKAKMLVGLVYFEVKKLPAEERYALGDQILEALERRMDPATRTVRPNWKGLARELHVSRSTISREVASLKRSGFFESIAVPVRPGSKISYVLYKLNTRPARSEPSPCPPPLSIRSQNSPR